MTIGENIKKFRKERKLTQEQLGNILGVKKAAIQKYENGTVKNLKQETIKKLSEYFGVDPINFIEAPPLTKQLSVIEDVKNLYGNDAIHILDLFTQLNTEGREKLKIYAEDMVKIYG